MESAEETKGGFREAEAGFEKLIGVLKAKKEGPVVCRDGKHGVAKALG